MDSYFGSNLQFVRIDLSIDVVLRVIAENVMFKASSYGLQKKKDYY